MLNITFKGEPYLLVAESLEEGGPIATPEQYKTGACSFAHYFAHDDTVKRFAEVIGTSKDIVVLGPSDVSMTEGEVWAALGNMFGGSSWWERP